MKLKDKIAIVTGGGAGLGRSIALTFAGEGAKVVIASRNSANLEKVAGEIRGKGGSATVIVTDISDESQVKGLVARTIAELGRVDILVNNTGIPGPTAAVVDLALDDWNRTLAVNLTGAMLCSREVLKDMIARQSGNIINMSSGVGKYSLALRSCYVVSKLGLIGFTETLSKEVGKYNIRFNCVDPGPVEGERVNQVIRTRAEALGVTIEDVARQMAARGSLGRFITAGEVVSAVLFLASDESSGITGQTLSVDSGKTG